jgi:hypothetical protein
MSSCRPSLCKLATASSEKGRRTEPVNHAGPVAITSSSRLMCGRVCRPSAVPNTSRTPYEARPRDMGPARPPGTPTRACLRSRRAWRSTGGSSSMSERFVGNGRLRLSGRNDARCTGCYGIRRVRATRCHRHYVGSCLSTVCRPDHRTTSGRPRGPEHPRRRSSQRSIYGDRPVMFRLRCRIQRRTRSSWMICRRGPCCVGAPREGRGARAGCRR